MQNFSIGTQIDKELEESRSGQIRLAALNDQQDTIRYLKKEPNGYYFNQVDAIALIDLYWNSRFETGPLDKLNQRKIFLNIGKFRSQVASKQIDIDTKDFRFIPDDYADPWTAIFLQKDFKEWSKESDFGDLVNQCVDNLPKYGSVVLKQVGRTLKFVPLQLLRNEQTADSLESAKYVIEEHPDMTPWEIEEMAARSWNTKDLALRYDETMTVYERYGYVPLAWLKKQNGETVVEGDENKFVNSLVIVGKYKGGKMPKDSSHIFFAGKLTKRPYREAHWDKQHGRWLGCGVMEDLVQNQQAKNIIINLIRRSLHWSSKRVLQSASTDVAAKNLVKDVEDGAILDVGANGVITEVQLAAKSNADFANFLNEFDKNSDQKAFTFEVATGEALPGGTPFRLGVLLSNAVNSYYNLKREKLGRFLKKAIVDFQIPQFLLDMGDESRVVAMFSGETGFEVLKAAAMQYVRTEAVRISLLSGTPVDVSSLEQIVQPFQEVQSLFFKLPKRYLQEAKYKFDFTVTGEEVDVEGKLETFKTIYQILAQKGDPRADKVLERIMALSGESINMFAGVPPAPALPPGTPSSTAAIPSNINARSTTTA